MKIRASQSTAGHPRRRGFTLIEILIVIGVIALLVGILTVAINVISNNMAMRRTRVAMENAKSLVDEFQLGRSFSAAVKGKVVSAANADPYAAMTIGAMATLRTSPKCKEFIEKMPANTVISLPITGPAVWSSASTVRYGFAEAVTHGGLTYRCLTDHVSSTTSEPGTLTGNPFWAVVQPPIVVPVDGWGKGLLLVGLRLDGLTSTVTGASAARPGVRSPTGQLFWVSAGPDGDFVTHDDNVYSFEN